MFVCISTQKAWGPLYQLPLPHPTKYFCAAIFSLLCRLPPNFIWAKLGPGTETRYVIDDIINVTHQNSSETASITKPCTCVRISLFIIQWILSKWPSKPYPFDSLPIKTLKFFSKNSEIKWMMQNRVWTHHLFLLTRHVTPALEMILNFIARRIKSYLRSTSWYKIKHCFLVFFKLESPILKNVSSHIECLAHFIQWLFSVQSVLLHNFCWQVFCCCMAVKRFTYKNMRSPAILFHSKE